jgi:hypothetical protein
VREDGQWTWTISFGLPIHTDIDVEYYTLLYFKYYAIEASPLQRVLNDVIGKDDIRIDKMVGRDNELIQQIISQKLRTQVLTLKYRSSVHGSDYSPKTSMSVSAVDHND